MLHRLIAAYRVLRGQMAAVPLPPAGGYCVPLDFSANTANPVTITWLRTG